MRIGFYTAPVLAFGAIHSELCKRLTQYGIQGEILDATVRQVISSFRDKIYGLDYVVTDPGASLALTRSYGIEPSRIVLISHGEPDMITLVTACGRQAFGQFKSFAVVSESLFQSALTLGLATPDAIVPVGINCEKFQACPPASLRVVGYAASYKRDSHYGVDIKRGHLARESAERAGLTFRLAEGVPFERMNEFYRSVDAVIMSSVQEGAGLPVIEAAAAGRLVIGTGVGHFPRAAYLGCGLLAPLSPAPFVNFTTNALRFYADNPVEFSRKCRDIQAASQLFDWACFEQRWAEYLLSLQGQAR